MDEIANDFTESQDCGNSQVNEIIEVFELNSNTNISDNMVSVDGQSRVKQADNRADFCSTIAGFCDDWTTVPRNG